ncbi:MAG: ADP-ribosylglycohydrolase family protein [Atopobiaceae bacterium]|nr:ADP-ribosylglycohydrolase family protein [Atopobiaceae bacterium]
MSSNDVLKDRFEGCLLAGAAGDALGYAIEFWDETSIASHFGKDGIQTLAQAAECEHDELAHFSDDTQMTLFTAEGLTHGMKRGHVPSSSDIWLAYREWLGTQGDTSRMDDPEQPRMAIYANSSLHELRAPGSTCLSAIRSSKDGGSPERPVNNSKGCGGIMRVAPIGLAASICDDIDPFVLGAQAAALTHGHPMGWLPAAALAGIVALLCTSKSPEDRDAQETLAMTARGVAGIIAHTFGDWGEARELRDLMLHAVDLALSPEVRDDLDCIHELGEGWVGDEALLIALYASIAHADNVAESLRCAANHKGDSDSTASIAGNILGALWGREAFAAALDLSLLEEVDLISSVADELLEATRALSALPEGAHAYANLLRIDNPPVPTEDERLTTLPEDKGMPYTQLTKKALKLSFDAHAKQRDRSGLPYVYHPFHLAEQMRSEEAACVALLHDTVEDGHLTLQDLRAADMTDEIIEGVVALTHSPDVPYLEYVLRLRTNPLAQEVKLADLRHNANLSRLNEVTPRDLQRRQKYLVAQALLCDDADFPDDTERPLVWHKPIPVLDRDDASLILTYNEMGRTLRLTLTQGDERIVLDATDVERLAEPLAVALEQGFDHLWSLARNLS